MKPLEPPSEPLLIDTDVLIDYLRGNQQAIAFLQQAPLILWVSSMTVAELYAGVREGKEREFLEQTLATLEGVQDLSWTSARKATLSLDDQVFEG